MDAPESSRPVALESRTDMQGYMIVLLASERQIRQRFERLAAEQGAMRSQMTEAVIIADPGGRVRYLNETAQRILGIDAAGGKR